MEELLHGGIRALHLHLLHHLARQALAVVLVQNQEILRIAKAINLAAEHLYAESVDGADEVIDTAAAPEHPRDAGLHLLRRLVGESHAEDVGRVDTDLLHQPRIARRQHTRLARAGAGHNLHTPFDGLHSAALLGVESAEIESCRLHTLLHTLQR